MKEKSEREREREREREKEKIINDLKSDVSDLNISVKTSKINSIARNSNRIEIIY